MTDIKHSSFSALNLSSKSEFPPFYALSNLISLIVGFRNPKPFSFENYRDEVQSYLDADAVPLLVSSCPTFKILGESVRFELSCEIVS